MALTDIRNIVPSPTRGERAGSHHSKHVTFSF
jgi:hypothetical protein